MVLLPELREPLILAAVVVGERIAQPPQSAVLAL
jgi:hypothetical protein